MANQMPSADSKHGAPMGRSEWPLTSTFGEFDASAAVFGKPARCFRLRMVDGDYDDGGAYWGGDGPDGSVYCATNGFDGTDTFQLFCRAESRAEAKAKFVERAPRIRWIN